MARKVFLSFLGVINYTSSKYYIGKKEPIQARFVQIASLNFFCDDFTENDKIFIFTTETAKEKNWEDYTGTNLHTKAEISTVGLKTELENSIFSNLFETIPIPEETSEEQIWDTFQIVFDMLEDDDEIIFDITHGFRSGPMLLMVLMNYAKFLKNISVRKILYGAFDISNKEKTKIWDLTNFALLQDWTSGANEFFNFGSTDKLTNLARKEILPIIKDDKTNANIAKKINSFVDNLNKLTVGISTVRGLEIYNGKTIKQINELYSEIEESNFIAPFAPIIAKINSKFKNYEEKSILNIFNIVSFCIEHRQVQQAVTFLQEAIVSFALYNNNLPWFTDKQQKYNQIRDKREMVSSVFNFLDLIENPNFSEDNWNWKKSWFNDEIELFKNDEFTQEIKSIYVIIGKYRNDINHGGFLVPKKSKNFLELLKNYFTQILEIVDYYLQNKS